MHRSSDQIGALALAMAKAQADLVNPERTLVGTLPSRLSHEEGRIFRYASLANGLDIVRKALGQHEIATIQTTWIDSATGRIYLTTLLAHSSGEWISSEWPVCASKDMDVPQRTGAALTYARRYALFTLVGIAGEDDLDAPEPQTQPDRPAPTSSESRKSGVKEVLHRQPMLDQRQSAALRDELLAGLNPLDTDDALLSWAKKGLPRKNALRQEDAKLVEQAYQQKLEKISPRIDSRADSVTELTPEVNGAIEGSTARLLIPKERSRLRSKAHLIFVRSHPCLVCKQLPCDAHHLRFAQPRALGRKVSDEFAVPLCRSHHRELHRHGNEKAWWANLQIAPLTIAMQLWDANPAHPKDLMGSEAAAAGGQTQVLFT
jgi:hypothetical protein